MQRGCQGRAVISDAPGSGEAGNVEATSTEGGSALPLVVDAPERRRWPFTLIGVAIGIAGSVASIEYATPTYSLLGQLSTNWRHAWDVTAPFLRDFSTSAGLGGVMALGAATVAYGGVRKTLERDRVKHYDQRTDELIDREEDRWWDMFKIIYADPAALGDEGATLVLDALIDASQTKEQDAWLDVLVERLEKGGPHA